MDSEGLDDHEFGGASSVGSCRSVASLKGHMPTTLPQLHMGPNFGGAGCVVCGKSPAVEDMKKFQGLAMCKAKCHPAVRAARRVFGSVSAEALENFDEETHSKPAAWASKVSPFLEDRKEARGGAKTIAMEYSRVETKSEVSTDKNVVEGFEVDEGEYITWRQRQNKFVSDEDARQQFWNLINEHGNKNTDPRGKPMVTVHEKQRRVQEHGTSSATSKQHVAEISAEEFGAPVEKRRRLLTKTCSEAASQYSAASASAVKAVASDLSTTGVPTGLPTSVRSWTPPRPLTDPPAPKFKAVEPAKEAATKASSPNVKQQVMSADANTRMAAVDKLDLSRSDQSCVFMDAIEAFTLCLVKEIDSVKGHPC